MNEELVSIVVPIYNVEKYLEQCIDSLTMQTYRNIEILLVDDGSTDGSLEICKVWKERDDRILLFSKENEGLGPTRNYGVSRAKGSWVAFVDADDWVSDIFIEKLYATVIEEKADIALCNYVQVNLNSGDKKKTNYFQTIGISRDEKVIFTESIVNGAWNQLISIKLFEEFNLDQPNCKSQDFAVGLVKVLGAKKCAFVNDALYYHRQGRPNALTTGRESKRNETAQIALPWLISRLKENGLYYSNLEIIKKNITNVFSFYLFGGWMNLGFSEYKELKNLYCKAMAENVDYKHLEIAHLGSWNLTEALRKTTYLQDMEYAFHFSSLISVMSGCNISINILHKSSYRRKMIEKDIYAKIWECFDVKKPDYFVFDLLEERNNIIDLGGSYITESKAFEECKMKIISGHIIKSGTDEWFGIWRQACDTFLDKLQNYLELQHVIVVRNYLAESYGDITEQKIFEEIDEIRYANQTMKKCYDYIQKNYPNIIQIHVDEKEKYITDIKYEYGVYPWYLNAMVNSKVATDIQSRME